MIRYTRRLKTKHGNDVTIKIFTEKRHRFIIAWLRGWYCFGQGKSYEFNDVW